MSSRKQTGVSTDSDEKARIRERYRGLDTSKLTVIPQKKAPSVFDDDVHRRVAVYARVSTDDVHQTSSYELQKNYYTDFIEQHPNWTLVGIYADEGISGTSLNHRTEFKRMLEDCRAGKIDLIVTKSISRFARNVADCTHITRELAALKNPVEVYFESDRISSLRGDQSMTLELCAVMAEQESQTKSTIMNASIEMRFSHGIFLVPELYGYTQDKDGNLIPHESQARVVQLIFYLRLLGQGNEQIARALTELSVPTPSGKGEWGSGSVNNILQNERHCGEVLARKTFTPSFLDHRTKKNRGHRNQYLQKKHHEGIITPEVFVAVQTMIRNAKYRNQGFFPQLEVVKKGALAGFVVVNPRWGSFTAADYFDASMSADADMEALVASKAQENTNPHLVGFEVARSQFFVSSNEVAITFADDAIKVSKAGVRKLDDCGYVELLIHPIECLLAIRPCDERSRCAFKWTIRRDEESKPVRIGGKAFLPVVYEILQWTSGCKYRVIGNRRQRNGESILIFDLKDTEVIMPKDDVLENVDSTTVFTKQAKRITGFPHPWDEHFGEPDVSAERQRGLLPIDVAGLWDVNSAGELFRSAGDAAGMQEDELRKQVEVLVRQIKGDLEGLAGGQRTLL